MSGMDVVIAAVLAAGLAVSLPIWYWLCVAPLARLCKRVARATRTLALRWKQHRAKP